MYIYITNEFVDLEHIYVLTTRTQSALKLAVILDFPWCIHTAIITQIVPF